jgi:hypothetical protein
MVSFFYIIPIPEKSVFKIGIATNLKHRFLNHQANWRSDFGVFDKGQILYTKAESPNKIKLLEQYLKYTFKDNIAGVRVSGHTEIYKIECLNNLVEETNRMNKNLGIPVLEKYQPKENETVILYPTKEERKQKKIEISKAINEENKTRLKSFVSVINSLKGKVELKYSDSSYYLLVNVLDGVNVDSSCFENASFQSLRLSPYGGFTLIEATASNNGNLEYVRFLREHLSYAKIMYPDVWNSINWEFKNVVDGIDTSSNRKLTFDDCCKVDIDFIDWDKIDLLGVF